MATLASDAERDRCALALRDHAAAGRLELDELEERLTRVYGARYRSELRAALRDLPRDHAARAVRLADRVDRFLLRAHAWAFALCALLLTLLWAAAGSGWFWPALMLLPWAVVLAWHVAGSWGVRRMLRRRAVGGLPTPPRRGRLAA